ncbi:LLM class flavin-dependent oxidoreductase [Frondihabitans cladoniiphilus]|uniref:LLM class flavin-dependent oxidoreductase n=1 Tax=Frondihabitans cladoniiphilus TaxID=715785 RepID=A0ABP8VU53_9MICO
MTALPGAAGGRAPGRVPLIVLDLVPISTGSDSRQALHNTIDLAQRAEAAGYARYWLAEHHLNPGIAGSSPHTVLAALGAATRTIRLGTAATILGNYEPIQVAEAFGTLAGLFGPRFDLGLGRSGAPKPGAQDAPPTAAAEPEHPANRTVDGLVVPPPASRRWFDRERFLVQFALLGRTLGDAEGFASQVEDILAFFDGTYRDPHGNTLAVHPAEGVGVEDSGVDVWIHGSTAGESARVAGRLGLPYGANYHVSPSNVLESVAEYRARFVPGRIAEPHLIVSVDVVVGETDEQAEELALGYAEWVASIRVGSGAIAYPSPDEVRADPLDPELLPAVQDRLDTRFVGSPSTVVQRLETLQRVTGADELLVTTVTHDHEARVRSYELLAEAWLDTTTPTGRGPIGVEEDRARASTRVSV